VLLFILLSTRFEEVVSLISALAFA
jgi:hypothetical protein